MMTVLSRAAKSLLFVAVAACSMHAATVTYTLTNLTLSAGDPVYDVASDVTFTNLSLSEVFADGASAAVLLVGPGNVAQNSLSTTTLDLNTAPQSDFSASHGALVNSILTGSLSLTNLSVINSFGGAAATVTVNPTFLAVLPISGSSVNVNATDSTGKTYAIGVLDQTKSGVVAAPEPGTFAIATFGLVTLLAIGRRFRKDLL